MGDKCKKQVKVDNWGMFFLQRLQQHFAKSEFCNFTLHFCNDQEIKAHRLVLDVCTEYFQLLEKQGLVVGNVVNMPEDMQPDVVIPVVNFMYTGRLEFHAELQERLYATAQQMKMTVLTKLLDAQTLNTQQQQSRSPGKAAAPRNTPLKKMSPTGSFTNLQGKRISPRPVDPNLPQMLPGRKLPIWTRRSIPHHSHTGTSHSNFERPIRIITTTVDEAPRPTRFEWPEGNDDDSSPCPLATTFEDISYESKPLVQLKTAGSSAKPKIAALVRAQPLQASFEDVMRTGAVMKRPAPPGQGEEEGEAKRVKSLDLQDVKDYVQEAQVRRHMMKSESDDEEEDVDNDLSTMDTEEETTMQDVRTPHKSILKTQSSHEEEPPPAKKVRFSLEAEAEEKENSAALKVETRAVLPTRAAANVSAGSTPHVTNHAKIITEVLKKYPHLVKNNKNIRLKIMQRGGQPQVAVERDAVSGRPVKSKVSYVVLKSDVSGQRGKSALGGGKLSDPQKPPTGAENVTGPWLCHGCGGGDPPAPLRLPTYFAYRRHLQDTHHEKIDARICEHCGHRASKRNLLLYHLYTKHGIAPPRNCQFPRCDQCDYVALSESLLIKHRNNHSNSRDFACKVCPATFKSNGALQGHMQTNLHSDPYKKLYECPFCQKPFMRNINLKAHVRSSHKEMVPRVGEGEAEEEGEGDGEEYEEGDEGEGQVMEVPVIEMSSEGQVGMTILAEHPDRSSEAEGFGHVASGIAASLGLEQTVILLDENQEYVIQTTEIVGGEYEDISEMQEYIVPEMINQDPPSAADSEQGLVAYVEEEGQEGGAEQGLVAYVEGTEQQMHGGTEEVLMILTDHCYAEEVVSKDDHVVQNGDPQVTEDQSDAAQMDNTSVCSAAESQAVQEMDSDSVTVQSDVKGSFAKPAVEMSDLLGEWDEELSQETEDGVEESAVASRQEALPTRGDIPAEMYSVRQMAAEASEAQHAVVVDAEEMAHDSASLMAETGENNALVMDVDSTFSQASQDTFTLHTEQTAQFAVETSHDTQFVANASQAEHDVSFPVGETDQNEQIAVESGHSAGFAAETEQLTIFTAETEEPPAFLPFSESKQTFVPFANAARTPALDGVEDGPGTQFVPEADPVTSLSSATIETDSLSIDADSRQGHLPLVGEAEGDLSFTEVPEQSEVKADDTTASTCVALEHAVAEGVHKEQASLKAELL